MKRTLLATAAMLPIISLGTASVSAREESRDESRRDRSSLTNRFNQWRQKGGVLGIKDWKVTDENCSKVQDRISHKADALNKANTHKLEKYQKVLARIENVITKANDQGLDTTKIQADLDLLKIKVDFYIEQSTMLSSKLADAANVDCNSDEGPDQLQVVLQEAREQLKFTREAMKEIHSYIKSTVITDLRDLKKQFPEDQSAEDKSENE